MVIEKSYFKPRAEVMEDIRDTGYRPTTFISGAWHAEGEVTDRVVYIVTLREAIPLREAIMPHEPKGPFRG
jgi:hypothetical protein